MPGIDGSRDHPAEARPPVEGERGRPADEPRRLYDPLDQVTSQPTSEGQRSPGAETPAGGERRQMHSLVTRIQRAVEDRFGPAPTYEPPPPTDLSKPLEVDRPTLADDTTTVYGRPRARGISGAGDVPPLFDGLPRRDQVRQGDLGDCWLMAGIGAVAGHNPDAIRDLMRQKPDGSVVVRLHDVTRSTYLSDWEPTGRRIELEVSPDLPVKRGDLESTSYADVSNTGVRWAAVLEKAFAGLDQTHRARYSHTVLTGYERLDRGGYAAESAQVLAMLTGECAGIYRMGVSAADMDLLVQELLDANRPVIVGTKSTDSPFARLPFNLIGKHAYEVTENNEAMLTLRNPYGDVHPEPMNVRTLLQQLDGLVSTTKN